MKRVMVLDQKGSFLISDILNQRIVRELVVSPLSTTELSRKLRMSPVKVWRRVSKLVDAGILEQFKVEYVGNLEKKVYRATALKFVPIGFLEFEPKNKNLKEAFKTYGELQRENMKDLADSNEIPQSAAMDPIDYGVYADLRTFCRIMLSERTHAILKRLEKQLTECKEFDSLDQTVSAS
jgi:DNA-binding Lrp family transcriptional regulator